MEIECPMKLQRRQKLVHYLNSSSLKLIELEICGEIEMCFKISLPPNHGGYNKYVNRIIHLASMGILHTGGIYM